MFHRGIIVSARSWSILFAYLLQLLHMVCRFVFELFLWSVFSPSVSKYVYLLFFCCYFLPENIFIIIIIWIWFLIYCLNVRNCCNVTCHGLETPHQFPYSARNFEVSTPTYDAEHNHFLIRICICYLLSSFFTPFQIHDFNNINDFKFWPTKSRCRVDFGWINLIWKLFLWIGPWLNIDYP